MIRFADAAAPDALKPKDDAASPPVTTVPPTKVRTPRPAEKPKPAQKPV